jgi:hypothetical protein
MIKAVTGEYNLRKMEICRNVKEKLLGSKKQVKRKSYRKSRPKSENYFCPKF